MKICIVVYFSKLLAGQANVEQLQKEAEATWDACPALPPHLWLMCGLIRYDYGLRGHGIKDNVGLHAGKMKDAPHETQRTTPVFLPGSRRRTLLKRVFERNHRIPADLLPLAVISVYIFGLPRLPAGNRNRAPARGCSTQNF